MYIKEVVIETLWIEQDGDALTFLPPTAIIASKQRGSAKHMKARESNWEVRNELLAKLRYRDLPDRRKLFELTSTQKFQSDFAKNDAKVSYITNPRKVLSQARGTRG